MRPIGAKMALYAIASRIPVTSDAADRSLVRQLTKQLKRYGRGNSQRVRQHTGLRTPKSTGQTDSHRQHGAHARPTYPQNNSRNLFINELAVPLARAFGAYSETRRSVSPVHVLRDPGNRIIGRS